MAEEESKPLEQSKAPEEQQRYGEAPCIGEECKACNLDEYDPLFQGKRARIA